MKTMSNNASPTPSLLISAAVLAVATLTGCPKKAAPPPKLPPPTPAQVVQAGEALLGQYEESYENRDARSLGALYSHDLDVTVIVQGKAYRGRTDVEAFLTGFLTQVDSIRLDLSETRVVALGDDAAEVRAAVKREYSEGSATRTELGSLVLGLTRVDDRWVIRSEHFSYGLR